jgi:hypothetical protein
MLLLHATALSNFHSAQTPKLMICADRPPKLCFCGSAGSKNNSLMSVVSRCRPNHCNKILYFQQQEIIPLVFIHTGCSKMIMIA